MTESSKKDQIKPVEKYFAAEPGDLLGSQKSAVRIVIDRFSSLTVNANVQRDNDKRETSYNSGANIASVQGSQHEESVASAHFDVDRPHSVFLVDGGRGAGKTFTLLSIEYALKQLTEWCNQKKAVTEDWQDFFNGVASAGYQSKQSSSVSGLKSLIKAPSGIDKAAETIRVIFPGDMLGGESIMEVILAYMARQIDSDIEYYNQRLRADDFGASEQFNRDQTRRLERLRTELRDEVAQGWYFARRFGLEALIRDSLDYDDLTNRWAKESSRSSVRIERWRKLVSEYLELRRTATLVVLVDDSDVNPELTEDVLHAIRMFLNHPRIVTVLAGNLKSMRDTLLYMAMKRIGPSMPALNQQAQPTAKDWRKRERQQIEEYLEKVLPPAQRIHIGKAFSPELRVDARKMGDNASARAGERGTDADFAKIAGGTLNSFVDNAQQSLRRPFLEAKFKLAISRELGSIDAPDRVETSNLEAFLAWWFFGNVYRNPLAPKSARQISTFGSYYERYVEPPSDDKDKKDIEGTHSDIKIKRLPVALFDHPSNYSLIQRLSDEDHSLPTWLRSQVTDSSWRDRRLISINGREVPENSYTHHYLSYRLDVGLAIPVRDNTAAVVPRQMLPEPVGRRYMRRFFQPRHTARRHRRIGIAKVIDHAAIPGNCVYIHQLQAFPDNTFADPENFHDKQSGKWEASLADNWFDILEDRDEQNNDERLKRYFREMICESLRGTEEVSSATLISELDPPDLYRKQSHSIYEHFLRDELGLMGMNPLERELYFLHHLGTGSDESRKTKMDYLVRRKAQESYDQSKDDKKPKPVDTVALFESQKLWPQSLATLDGEKAKRPANAPMRMIALYSALATDLRRAWLAARLYEAAPKFSAEDDLEDESETGRRASLAVLGHKDRLTLFTRKNLEELLERSSWVKSMINVFTPDNLTAAFGEDDSKTTWFEREPAFDEDVRKTFFAKNKKVDAKEAINDLFSLGPERGEILDQLQAIEEPADFKRWTQTLRWIGREICKNWPVDEGTGHNKKITKSNQGSLKKFSNETLPKEKIPENVLFRHAKSSEPMLKIFQSKLEGTPDEQLSENERNIKRDALNQLRKNARSARNLVWLLYGMAPSLPAIIHSHIMSIVYEAELNWQLIEQMERKSADEVPKFYRDEGQFDQIVRGLQNGYFKALSEIEEWAKLIGSLSVILRYIKIKCLHLDIVLVLERLGLKEPFKLEKDDTLKFDQRGRIMNISNVPELPTDQEQRNLRLKILERSGYSFPKFADEEQDGNKRADSPSNNNDGTSTDEHNDEAVWLAYNRLKSIFHRKGISTILAIFPDVSPSTLFGDDWIKDILSRKGVVEVLTGRVKPNEYASFGGEKKYAKIDHEPPENDQERPDDPVSVNGIFGETEQWLWSSNRTLRKLMAVLTERRDELMGKQVGSSKSNPNNWTKGRLGDAIKDWKDKEKERKNATK